MCGLYGVIGSKKINIEKIEESIGNRGPDFLGKVEFDNCIFLHSRLSIQDLSSLANQPFLNKNKDIALLFNGEIYNYKKLRKRLENHGESFSTNSDTEVLLKGFELLGSDFFNEIDGIYAIAVWNDLTKELTLVRDPFGIKPLYFYLEDELIRFGSELSAFEIKEIDKKALENYQIFGSISEPHSGLVNLKKFPAGCVGKWSKNKGLEYSFKKKSFLYNKFEKAPSYSDAVIKVKELLKAAVKSQTIGDVEIASFLSGGIDSGILTALLQENSVKKIRTFSIGFSGFDGVQDESYDALINAKFLGTNHTNIIYKLNDFDELFDEFIDAIDAPSTDGFNSYLISKAVSSADIKVAFSGLGADEIFAGYPHFDDYYNYLKNKNKSHKLGGRLPVQLLKKLNMEGRAYEYRKLSAYLDCRIIPFNGIPRKKLRERIDRYINDSQIPSLNILETSFSSISLAELSGYLKETLLRDTDAVSMHFGLEVRVPYLDSALVSYCLSLPFKYHLSNGSKSILKDAFYDYLPEKCFKRKKTGFVIPLGHWILRNKRFSPRRISKLLKNLGISSKLVYLSWTYLLNNPNKWYSYWRWIVLAEWSQKR